MDDRDVIANFNLASFVKHNCMNRGDVSVGSDGRIRQRGHRAQYDFGIQKLPFCSGDVFGKIVRADEARLEDVFV